MKRKYGIQLEATWFTEIVAESREQAMSILVTRLEGLDFYWNGAELEGGYLELKQHETATVIDVDPPEECECDNTHEANNTVCRYCWANKNGSNYDPKIPNKISTG